MATSKLSSVPFAIKAQTVVNDKVDDADHDPTNEIQKLKLTGTLLELSDGGGSVTLPTSGGGGGDNWGAQTVKTDATLTGDGTSGNPLSVVADGDGDDSNELQTLELNGNDLSLSDGGSVTLPTSPWSEDADGTFEAKVYYRGAKFIQIGDAGSPTLKTKSATYSAPAKLDIRTESRMGLRVTSHDNFLTMYVNNSGNGAAVKFYSKSNLPTAYFHNSGSGGAARFSNQIQIKDGTQGVGKVLTSDADGNASWQEPTAGGSSPWTETSNEVAYRGNKTVIIGDASGGSSLKIKSAGISTPPKLDISTGAHTGIHVYNETDSYYGINIWNEEGTAAYFGNNSDMPVAVFDNNDTGLAADFRNAIKITDGNQGAGKVLTSDANGKASWENDLSVNELTAEGDVFLNQNLEVADDLTVGSITISAGEIQNTSTGSANMIPIAYGSVRSDGTIIADASSGNFTVDHPSTGKYQITITGVTYIYTTCAQSVTLIGHAGFVRTGSASGKLLVYTYDVTGDDDADKKDIMFSFVVYKP